MRFKSSLDTFLISLILMLLTTTTVLSQTYADNPGTWKIGINFTPGIFLNATSNMNNGIIGYTVEPSGFAFSTGLTGYMTLKPKLDFGTGLLYSQKDYTLQSYCYVCEYIVDPPPEPVNEKFIEIPVLLRYYFFDRKFDMHVETGITGGYLINDLERNSEEEIFTSKFLLSGQLGFGFSIDLGQNFNLGWTAIYKQTLTNFSAHPSLKSNSIGISTGLIYELKKTNK
jgi:hypothetical protein